MQQHVKYLVVEDEPKWSAALTEAVRTYFEDEIGLYKARILDDSALNGDQGLQRLKAGTYDLVTLDMNLGAGGSKSKISGLDLLGRIADGNRAFFVIIVTGAVNDPSLERIYGKEAAALMRYGALNEAVKKLPAERVRILHKPDATGAADAMEKLLPHLHSALDQYRSVSLERNVFRPYPRSKSLWEVRYNGGPRMTIPAREPFELIRSALAQPNREMKVIQLVQAIAQSSGKGGAIKPQDSQASMSRRNAGEAKDLNSPDAQGTEMADRDSAGAETEYGSGLDFRDLEKMESPDHVPVDTKEGTITLEVLIGALLMARRQRYPLQPVIDAFVDQYGEGPLLLLPGKIKHYAGRPQRAEEEFQIDSASGRLAELNVELNPIIAPLRESVEAAKKAGVAPTGKSKKTRVSTGHDSKELQNARAHWKRARKYLRDHEELEEFVAHIEKCVERGITAKGHIHYMPADGSEFPPFWLTE